MELSWTLSRLNALAKGDPLVAWPSKIIDQGAEIGEAFAAGVEAGASFRHARAVFENWQFRLENDRDLPTGRTGAVRPEQTFELIFIPLGEPAVQNL
jgi:hypothetical protein